MILHSGISPISSTALLNLIFSLLAATALCAQGAAPRQPARKKDFKAFYANNCAACHGLDGSGKRPDGTKLPDGKDLTSARLHARRKDGDFARTILKGDGAMPAFGGELTEAEALQLVREIIRPFAKKS